MLFCFALFHSGLFTENKVLFSNHHNEIFCGTVLTPVVVSIYWVSFSLDHHRFTFVVGSAMGPVRKYKFVQQPYPDNRQMR